MKRLVSLLTSLGVVAALAASATVAAADNSTLATVKERGQLICGVNSGLPGFSATDADGNWAGLDVDFCRAVAAAIFDDPQKVRFVPLTAKERFTALQSGEIDVLSRNTTWTLTRDASLGVNFAGTTYYDGQGFLVKKSLGVDSARQLSGATVCVLAGTTTELNLADYFRKNGMEYNPLVLENSDQTISAFNAGRCDVLTSDQSQLNALRIKLPEPSAAKVLPEVISKEPLGPAVRQGDDQWYDIIKWTLFTLINAEELGVNSNNVADMQDADNPTIRRMLGSSGDMGEKLGLPADFGTRIIKHVGNYAEIYRRNVGADSPLELERGVNALWTDGGLMYAPPIR
ncbi:amino acid ABC transporter substrate-binding protein [Arhodomonas aquaeolei]|uniref:amino acid ABC transporter substrate-binding protein n=1 Tax=Arhodomonas aquaeolei TaxID=2369 RepID=UPI00037184F9|nr:amino acid ABC transporter substrate-binding protein [Arhodomonas aquaeolei]